MWNGVLGDALHLIFLTHFPEHPKSWWVWTMACSLPLVYLKPILLIFQSSLAETFPFGTGSWLTSGVSADIYLNFPWLLWAGSLTQAGRRMLKREIFKTFLIFKGSVLEYLSALASPCSLPSLAPCGSALKKICADRKKIYIYFTRANLSLTAELEGWMVNSCRAGAVTALVAELQVLNWFGSLGLVCTGCWKTHPTPSSAQNPRTACCVQGR